MSIKKKAVLVLIIANIIWGAASPIFKWSLTNIQPFTLAFLRFSLGSIILFPFCARNLIIKPKDILKVVAVGVTGIGINIPFFFLGLKAAPSVNAPIIASSGPIFLMLGSILFLHERPKKRVILGTAVSLLGVMAIILRPFLESNLDGAVLGNIFFLIATLAGVAHAIIVKQVLKYYPALTVTFWSFVVGSLIFLPFLITEIADPYALSALDHRGIIGIIFGVFFCSTIAYFFYNWGIQKIEANKVGIFTYIDPVVAILIAIPLLGEVITLTYILGSFLVFLGIFIAEGRFNYHPINQLFTHVPRSTSEVELY